MSPDTTHYTLIYFKFRGRAEPLRYMFALANVPYEDVRIDLSEWTKYRQTTPMGLLPILKVNGKPLCQTIAIARFLADKFGLAPKNSWDTAWADMLADGLVDMMRPFRLTNMHAMFGKLKEKEEEWQIFKQEYLVPIFLTRYENFLIDNGGQFFAGDSLTWVDILIAEQINRLVDLFDNETLLDDFPTLKDHMKRIHNLPGIKEYVKNRPVTIA